MHKTVLLSIKPEFAEKILDGTKTYEFRRTLFKDKDVKTVLIYASSPVQRVIGEFEVEAVLSLPKHDLWHKTHTGGAISRNYFDEYFNGSKICHAICIRNPKRYKHPMILEDASGLNVPPQSFAYVKKNDSRETTLIHDMWLNST